MVQLVSERRGDGGIERWAFKKKDRLIIGKKLVSIRGSKEFRFLLKNKVPKVRTYGLITFI